MHLVREGPKHKHSGSSTGHATAVRAQYRLQSKVCAAPEIVLGRVLRARTYRHGLDLEFDKASHGYQGNDVSKKQQPKSMR